MNTQKPDRKSADDKGAPVESTPLVLAVDHRATLLDDCGNPIRSGRGSSHALAAITLWISAGGLRNGHRRTAQH